MAVKKLRLRVVTPEREKVNMDVDMVIARCTTGDMGFLPGHMPLSAVLDIGALRVINEGEERRMAISGGIVQVYDNTVSVLTNDALWPDEIDSDRAEKQREEAQQKLQDEADAADLQRGQFLLRRSLVYLEVSSFPILNKPSK